MRELNLTVFEPGDILGTISKDGKVAVFSVNPMGALVPSDNRMFQSGITMDDPIEVLDLTVRTYNVLKRESINTVGEMTAVYDEKGRDGFADFRNMGEKCIDEIVGHIDRLRGNDSE